MDTKEMPLTFVREEEDIKRLNNWMFDNIQAYIKGRTLELGSGNGSIASLFIARELPIHLSEEDDVKREILHKQFDGISAVRMIHNIDFHHLNFNQIYADKAGAFSTIIAINIPEHGVFNRSWLQNAKCFLRIRGHFIVATPANAVLFNDAASNLEDLKEYNLKIARNLMGDTFEVLKVRYFDWSPGPNRLVFDQSGLYTLAIFRKKQN